MNFLKLIETYLSFKIENLQKRSIRVQEILCKPFLSFIGSQNNSLELVRRTKEEEKALIAAHSILDQKVEFPILNSSEDEFFSFFSQIHGTTSFSDLRMRNFSLGVTLKKWIAYLEHSTVVKPPSFFIEKLKQLLVVSNKLEELRKKQSSSAVSRAVAEELMQTVHQLPEGQSYLIEGGKIDEKGIHHPIVFEFIKQDKETYELVLYLVGNQNTLYCTTVERSYKTWFNPIIRYSHIPAALLFFNDSPETTHADKNDKIQSDFFQALIATNQSDQPPDYIFLNLLGHLEKYQIKTLPEVPSFISPSEHYSDSWQIGKVLMIQAMGMAEYKKLIREIKLSSLIEGYQFYQKQLTEDSPRADNLRCIFKKSAKNILKNILKDFLLEKTHHQVSSSSSHNSSQSPNLIRLTALDLLNRIKKIDQSIKEKRQTESILLSLEACYHKEASQTRIEHLNKLTSLVIEWNETTTYSPDSISTFHPFLLPPIEHLLNRLETFLARSPCHKRFKAFEIEQLIDSLPIPGMQNEYWKAVPEKEVEKILKCFEMLLNDYDSLTRGSSSVTPKQTNTVFALYSLIHHLAIQVDNKKNPYPILHQFPAYFPGFECDHDLYLIELSPHDFDRAKSIRDYFTQFYLKQSTSSRGSSIATLFHFSKHEKIKHMDLQPDFTWLAHIALYHSIELKLSNTSDTLTKIITLLQEIQKHHCQKTNHFTEAGLEYIPTLFEAAFIAYQFASHAYMRVSKEGTIGFQIHAKRPDSFKISYYAGHQANTLRTSRFHNDPSNSASLHSPLKKDSIEWLTTFPWNKKLRKTETKTEEIKALESGKKLLREACEPELYPYKLINYFTENMHELALSDNQTLFETQFFRSVSMVGSEISLNNEEAYRRILFFPLKEEINTSFFRTQCQQFIEQGVDCYFYHQPEGHPHLFPLLFFLRLSMSLNRFTEPPLFNHISVLLNLLKIKNLKPEEKSVVCLHLVASYLLQKRELDEKEKEELLFAWIYYKNTSISKNNAPPYLQKEVESQIYLQMDKLQKFSQDAYQQAFNIALTQVTGLKYSSETDEIERITTYHIKVKIKENKSYSLNVLTAELSNETGVLKQVSSPSWVTDFLFKELFPDRPSSFLQIGDTIYFSNSSSEQFRVIGDSLSTGLQRSINGRWYQYLFPKGLLNIGLPTSLVSNHTHWLTTHSPDYPLLAIFNHSNTKMMTISTKGEIRHGNDILEGALQETPLSRFENPRYIVFTFKQSQMDAIRFTRYHSLNGEPLEFIMQKGKAIYGPNRKYSLSHELQKGLLGKIDHYLLLTNEEEEKKKILVPFPLFSHRFFESSKQNTDRTHSSLSSPTPPLKEENSLLYLELDFIEGKIVPSAFQEGALFLACLALYERDYTKAVQWINQVSFKHRLSDHSILMIETIIASAESIDPSSVEVAAIALHAWTLGVMSKYYLLNQAKRAVFLDPEIEQQIIKKLHQTYCIHHHDLPYDLQLSEEQKNYLPLKNEKIPEVTSYEISRSFPSTDVGAFFSLHPDQQQYDDLAFLTKNYLIARLGSPAKKNQLAFLLRTKGLKYVNESKEAWNCLQYGLNHPKPADKNDEEKIPNFVEMGRVEIELFFDKILENISLYKNTSRHLEFPTLSAKNKLYSAPTPNKLSYLPSTPQGKIEFLTSNVFSSNFSLDGTADLAFLSALFKGYFDVLGNFDNLDHQEPNRFKCNFSYDERWLSEDQKFFKKAFEEEIKTAKAEYESGQLINEVLDIYTLKNEEELHEKLKEKILNLKGELTDLECALLEIANYRSNDEMESQLKIEVGFSKELSLQDLIRLFLQTEKEEFYQANPHLKGDSLLEKLDPNYKQRPIPYPKDFVVIYLHRLIGLYLSQSVFMNQLKRAEKLCKEIEKIKEKNSLKRHLKIQKLANELDPSMQTQYLNLPKKSKKIQNSYPILLVFEYLTRFSLKQNQVSAIDKFLDINPKTGTYQNQIIQLGMGLGKTTFIASILLQIAAKPGRLALFVVPSSLYETARYHLSKTLRECFGKDLEEINVVRKDLTLPVCLEIERRLQHGKVKIVKPETLQCILLEFIYHVFMVREKNQVDAQTLKLMNCLGRILSTIKQKGDAIFDEGSLTFNPMQKMHFPIGAAKKADPIKVKLIRYMFSIMISEKASISPDHFINLKELIGLQENRQTFLSKEDLHGVVAQAIAQHLVLKFKPLSILNQSPTFAGSFYRYISGKISKETNELHKRGYTKEQKELLKEEEKNDVEFLGFLDALGHSHKEFEKEIADLIALTKHMLQSVLPVTLQKKGNQHYGERGDDSGKKHPYPLSDNEFGHPWEAVAYYFQAALQMGISKKRIEQMAKNYHTLAEQYSVRENCPLNETPQFKKFHKMTGGINFTDVYQPEGLKQAESYLKQHAEALLIFEAESLLDLVKYYPKRLCATGHSLAKMVASARVLDGTPWNIISCEASLANHFEPDVGSEGRVIAKTFLQVASKQGQSVHFIKGQALKQIFSQLFDTHPQKESVAILLDPGAIFKDYKNLEVAFALRAYFKKPILFFTEHPDMKQKGANRPALLKLGLNTPVFLDGTTLEVIERTGLTPEDYFVYLDESHTIGTDLPLRPDAIGFMTMDETMLSYKFSQTIMRLRDFLLTQSIEFVIHESMLKHLLPIDAPNEQLRALLGAYFGAIKNQAIQKSLQFSESRKQAIDHLFVEEFLHQLLPNQLNLKLLQEKAALFEHVIISEESDQLYETCGSIQFFIDHLESLTHYKDKKMQAFKSETVPEEIIEKLSVEANEIVSQAPTSPYFAEKVLEKENEELGIQFNILTQIDEHLHLDLQQNVEIQILESLNHYKATIPSEKRPEDQWEAATFYSFLQKMKKGENWFDDTKMGDDKIRNRAFSISEIFLDPHYKYHHDFSKIFHRFLRVTTSWVYSTNQAQSVFNELQRPADALLIVKTDHTLYEYGYTGILLAQNECNQFKKFLEKDSRKNRSVASNCWLVQSNGHLFAGATPLPHNALINQFILECNVLNGRIDYLDTHPKETMKWLYGENDSERKIDFLKLKIADKGYQRKLFFTSELFGQSKIGLQRKQARENMKNFSSMTQKDIQEVNIQNKGILSCLSSAQINLIRPEQVSWLAPHRVSELTDPSLIQEVKKTEADFLISDQMPFIASHQVRWFKGSLEKTQKIPISFAPEMDKDQFALISPDQISKIDDPDTIKRLSPEQFFHVTEEQVITKDLVSNDQLFFVRKLLAIQSAKIRLQTLNLDLDYPEGHPLHKRPPSFSLAGDHLKRAYLSNIHLTLEKKAPSIQFLKTQIPKREIQKILILSLDPIVKKFSQQAFLQYLEQEDLGKEKYVQTQDQWIDELPFLINAECAISIEMIKERIREFFIKTHPLLVYTINEERKLFELTVEFTNVPENVLLSFAGEHWICAENVEQLDDSIQAKITTKLIDPSKNSFLWNSQTQD